MAELHPRPHNLDPPQNIQASPQYTLLACTKFPVGNALGPRFHNFPKILDRTLTSLCHFDYSFVPLHQKVCLNSLKVQDTNWPPKKPTNNSSLRAEKRSHFSFKLTCGDSDGKFEFGLYKFVDPSPTSSTTKISSGSAVMGHMTPTTPPSGEVNGQEAALLQHHVVDMS